LVTQPQIYIFAILGTLLILLIWGRLRFDVVAFTALLLGVLAGVVPPARAFAGFGHPATITVAAVLVLSRVLSQSGAVDPAARALRPLEIWRTAHIAGLAGLGAVLSAFMNNVGTLGLLMPVALQSARRLKRPAGLLLMPLSFGTILGGLITMIGTPPNIIIATFRTQVAGEPFTMFDFAPVGLVTAVAGIGFVALVGWRAWPQGWRVGRSFRYRGLYDRAAGAERQSANRQDFGRAGRCSRRAGLRHRRSHPRQEALSRYARG
jgi:di/tricarboxylate transporter